MGINWDTVETEALQKLRTDTEFLGNSLRDHNYEDTLCVMCTAQHTAEFALICLQCTSVKAAEQQWEV